MRVIIIIIIIIKFPHVLMLDGKRTLFWMFHVIPSTKPNPVPSQKHLLSVQTPEGQTPQAAGWVTGDLGGPWCQPPHSKVPVAGELHKVLLIFTPGQPRGTTHCLYCNSNFRRDRSPSNHPSRISKSFSSPYITAQLWQIKSETLQPNNHSSSQKLLR